MWKPASPDGCQIPNHTILRSTAVRAPSQEINTLNPKRQFWLRQQGPVAEVSPLRFEVKPGSAQQSVASKPWPPSIAPTRPYPFNYRGPLSLPTGSSKIKTGLALTTRVNLPARRTLLKPMNPPLLIIRTRPTGSSCSLLQSKVGSRRELCSQPRQRSYPYRPPPISAIVVHELPKPWAEVRLLLPEKQTQQTALGAFKGNELARPGARSCGLTKIILLARKRCNPYTRLEEPPKKRVKLEFLAKFPTEFQAKCSNADCSLIRLGQLPRFFSSKKIVRIKRSHKNSCERVGLFSLNEEINNKYYPMCKSNTKRSTISTLEQAISAHTAPSETPSLGGINFPMKNFTGQSQVRDQIHTYNIY